MARKLGMGLLRLIAVIGGVSILAVVVLTAGSAIMPGTKMRKLFGASAEALAGNDSHSQGPRTLASMTPGYVAPEPTQALGADGGTPGAPDAGTPEAVGR
ncbi:MAG TPA: hypothetical protein VF815_19950 [Myxococcaceae bacterium]|jgi:hypothetical protein